MHEKKIFLCFAKIMLFNFTLTSEHSEHQNLTEKYCDETLILFLVALFDDVVSMFPWCFVQHTGGNYAALG